MIDYCGMKTYFKMYIEICNQMDSIKFTLSGKTMVRKVELLAAFVPLLVDLKISRKHKRNT
jgi:hypothetical protein